MIRRGITDILHETLQYFPVTGIVGPRQVGKTTLAKEITKELNVDWDYVDLENPRDEAKLLDPVLYFERNIDKCVILDEIQRMPHLFPILRSMIDLKRTPGRFIILGSASPELIRDSSESLAGRIAYEELTPFNIKEVDDKFSMHSHWLNGGFPNALLAPKPAFRKKWITNFIQTYIERDLPMLGLDVDKNILRRFWVMLAHLHGNVVNMSTIAKSLEISSTTAKRYLSFMEEAFLIRLLQPYSINVKKRLVKSPKVYIRDTGILHHLLAIPNMDALESNPILGNSWEGYALEQIIQQCDDELDYYFYRTHQGSECDMVLTKAGKPIIGIEIKYTAAPKITKGMLISFDDLKTQHNYVITPDSDTFGLSKDITACSLSHFIKEVVPIL